MLKNGAASSASPERLAKMRRPHRNPPNKDFIGGDQFGFITWRLTLPPAMALAPDWEFS
jgi:hypothetical protein